jgi:Domain of unknown function (DUF4126)
MENLLAPLLSGLGLSGAAGLNAYIPLLLVGVLERSGLLHLSQPFDLLGNLWVLAGVALLAAFDFVGDKIPGVDHALHLFGGILNVSAGALLFASQQGLVGQMNPALAAGLGLLVSGGVHATRTVLRPVSTGATAGLGNPLVSGAEDGSSLLISLLAVFAPILAVLLLVALLVLTWRGLSRLRRRLI